MNRTITTDFWLDAKVEEMSSTAKYLLLYLLTNPKTNLAGCYEVTYRRAAIDTGLTAKQVENAIAELCEANVIGYCADTNECLIYHWDRYNWTRSPKLDKPLVASISEVKNKPFMEWLVNLYETERGKDFPRRSDTVSEFSDTVSEKNQKTGYLSIPISKPITKPKGVGGLGEGDAAQKDAFADEIIACLNAEAGTSYRPNTKKTVQLIRARLNEGFTVDDFKAVISKKASDWRDDQRMSRYLRPETLFGTKFEGYLQEAKAVSNDKYAKYR